MGATYTRQSSSTIVDGATIEASHFNAEFDQILAAFQASTGHTHDGTANEGGPITKLLGNTLTFGAGTAGTDISITFDGETSDGVLKWMEDEDYFEFSDDILVASTEKLQFRDTAIYINSSTDGQLDLVADTEIQIAATTVDINASNVDISGNLTVGGTLDLSDQSFTNVGSLQLDSIAGDADTNTSITFSGSDVITVATGGSTAFTVNADQSVTFSGAVSFGDNDITNVGSIALDTITADGTDVTIDSGGDIILDADGANVTIKDGGTSILDIANASTDVELTVSTADKNFKIKGTDGSSAITALDIDMALAGKATFNGDVVIGGDLTVTGDDITMGTNTAGHILVADGANFNPIAVTSLSEISTVANDDVFLAVDATDGGLKKIARSAIVSGLATSGAISNVVEDSTPQLGGDLDVNGNGLTSTSNGNIALTPNGTGVVRIDGSNGIDMQSGAISIKNSGSESYIRFYCESSNAHYSQLQASPHSAYSGNVTLVLPASADTLVGRATTDTLTNKTLTTPVIAEIDSGSTITLDATTDIVLDADGGDIFLKDGGTTFGEFTNSSTDFVIKSTASDKDILFKGTDGSSAITALTLDMSEAGAATFNDKITAVGTSVFTNLDISGDVDVDGTLETDALSIASTAITATAAEINLIDGGATVGTTAIADGDGLIINDAGTMRVSTVQTLAAYLDDEITAMPNLVTTAATTVGALDSGSITSGFGNIDNGASNITSGGLVKIDVDADADDLTGDSTTGRLTLGAGEDLNLYHGGSNSYIVNDTGDLIIDTAGDIQLDAAGNDFKFLAGGTEIFNITNSSSDVILKPIVDTKDIIIQQRDGNELVNFNDANYSSFTRAAFLPEATLTDASTISWDTQTSSVAKVTLAGNRTLGAATNAQTGQFVSLLIIQDGTGSRTVTFNAVYEFASDTAPTLTTTASKGDLFVFRYNGSKFLEVGRNLNLTLS